MRTFISADEIDQIKAMRRDQIPWREIGRRLHRNVSYLCKLYNNNFQHIRKYECKNCGAPTNSERKLCRKPDCRKVYMREHMRDNRIKYVYGLTSDDITEMLVEQGGTCALSFCEVVLTPDGMHIDHDHNTGVIRGICCPRHNKGLGFFDDDPEKLRRAAEYLERGLINATVC